MDPVYHEFGLLVRKARLAADLTQQELARRVGLTRTSITNIESGRQVVALHTLFSLAASLDIDSTALLPKRKMRAQRTSQVASLPLPGLGKAEQEWVAKVIGKGGESV